MKRDFIRRLQVKPVIGVTLAMGVDEKQYFINSDNPQAIIRTGGMPILLTYDRREMGIVQIAEMLDGLVMTGGDDIDPTLFGEEPHRNLGPVVPARDQFEIKLTQQMLRLNKPILALCRGAQILNIAAGGDMYQDMYDQIDRQLLQHSQKSSRAHGTHYVNVERDTLLHQITQQDKIRVNSDHHQANRKVADGFQVCGKASDGIIEALESKQHRFVLGVQWHPENMVAADDDTSVKIYKAFISACQQ